MQLLTTTGRRHRRAPGEPPAGAFLTADDAFGILMIVAFLKFLGFFMLGMRYLLRIWVTTRPAAGNAEALRRELGTVFAAFCTTMVDAGRGDGEAQDEDGRVVCGARRRLWRTASSVAHGVVCRARHRLSRTASSVPHSLSI